MFAKHSRTSHNRFKNVIMLPSNEKTATSDEYNSNHFQDATQEDIEEIKNNPLVYTTQEGIEEIKNNPQKKNKQKQKKAY